MENKLTKEEIRHMKIVKFMDKTVQNIHKILDNLEKDKKIMGMYGYDSNSTVRTNQWKARLDYKWLNKTLLTLTGTRREFPWPPEKKLKKLDKIKK